MKKYILFFLAIGFMSSLTAQQVPEDALVKPNLSLNKPEKLSQEDYGKMVTPEGIKKHLTIIASDEMEGRETGEPGQRKAADYIANHFASLGFPKVVEGSYFQKIKFVFQSWEDLNLAVGEKKYRFLWDYYAFPASNSSLDEININEVVALGYGIDDEKYSDYAGVDVAGKTIMIYQGEPLNYDSVSYITGEKTYSDWAMDWKKKLRTAKEKGVKNVLFIEPSIQAKVSKYRDRLLRGSLTMGDAEYSDTEFPNSVYISTDVAKAILGKKLQKKFIKNRNKIRKKGKPRNLTISTDMKLKLVKNTKTLEGENVLGFLEGTDKKDEIVVVTAHYDHLGKRGKDIYNGADDNGSGTSTVLHMSSVFAEATKAGAGPRRSILFMLVSGEEKGLLGSEYYTNYPIFPLENTVVDVNVDMIGRVDEDHKDNPNYIYVIGSDRLSTELHEINEAANKKYAKIELDYTYNAEDDPNRYYYRSDHYNFAEKGIPAIFYFSGVHEDYHKTSDTVEKINFDKTARIGQLIFHTIWELANREKRIEVDVMTEEK